MLLITCTIGMGQWPIFHYALRPFLRTNCLKVCHSVLSNSLEKICGTFLSEEVCMQSITLQHAQM